jgi:aldehyde dehydrogenase (NAD+)
VLALAGVVWLLDLEKAMSVARSLRAVTIGINEWHVLNERAPFGGYRQRGTGLDELHEYTEIKRVHIDEVVSLREIYAVLLHGTIIFIIT